MDDLIENKLKELFCSLVSDVLDELGYENQAFPHYIRPLDENLRSNWSSEDDAICRYL